jgi:hypothetical protein
MCNIVYLYELSISFRILPQSGANANVSDYSNSDSAEYELLVDINKELLKYDYSLGGTTLV